MSADLPRHLSYSQAAELLGLAEGTLRNLVWKGSGPRYLKLGRRTLFDPRDLARWADAKKRGPSPAKGA